MRRPWLTKVWIGRHWRYIHTRRRYWMLGHRLRWGVASYKRSSHE